MKNNQSIDTLLMRVFFTYAWKRKPKLCECGCNKYLSNETEPNTASMDHLLEKSIYPECKYAISNIMFLRTECHTNKTNGFPNEKQQERTYEALKNYNVLKEESSKFAERILNKIGGE